MPKKTKKQKLLARYHKKLYELENRQSLSHSIQKKVNAPPVRIINDVVKPMISEPLNQYFFSDFRKSLLLITLIIGVEVALYFAKFIK